MPTYELLKLIALGKYCLPIRFMEAPKERNNLYLHIPTYLSRYAFNDIALPAAQIIIIRNQIQSK